VFPCSFTCVNKYIALIFIVSTFVYSACNSLINFYGFRSPPDQSALTYSSFQGTINVAVEAGADEDDFQIEKDFMIRGVCWNTTALLVEDDNSKLVPHDLGGIMERCINVL